MVSVEQKSAAVAPALLSVLALLGVGVAGSFGLLGAWLAVALAVAAAAFAGWTIIRTATPENAAAHEEAERSKRLLAEQQANLMAFFDYAPLQVYVTDLDHKIVMVNDWVYRETGAEVFRPENVIGLSADQMVPSSWAEMSHDNDETVVDKRGVTQVEVRGQFGGKERDIISIRFPIKDADGEVIRIGGFVVDVTEQESARREAENARVVLQSFVDNVPMALTISDLSGRHIMVNPLAARHNGTASADMTGTDAETNYGGRPELALYLDTARKVAESKQSQVIEVTSRSAESIEDKHVLVTMFPLFDGLGEVIQVGTIATDITDIHKSKAHAESARREAENARAMLQAFSDNVPAGLSIKDRDRNFTMINEFSARSYYAAKPADLIGKNADEIRTRRHGDHLYAMEQAVLDTGKAQSREVSFRAVDGAQRHMHLMFFPITDESGAVTHIGSLTNDITEQRQDQQELAQSQAMLQAFFENIPAMTFIISLDRRYVTANRYAVDKNGMEFLSPENLIGQPDTASTPPEWHPVIAEAHRTVVEEGKSYVTEPSIDLPGGTYHLLVSRFPIRNAEGEITHVGGLLFDRTAERQAEAALAEREATLQAFFDNLPGLAFLSSSEGEIIAANSFMTEYFGIPNMRSENLVGKKGRDLLPRSWNAQADAAVETNEKDGKSYAFDQTIKLPDGERHVASVRFPIRNKEGETTHIGGLVFDRTAEKQAADAVNAAKEGMHQSEKLAALGQLLAGVAHELNNPLAIVMGRAAMLKEKLAGTAHEDSIQRLRDAADRCARIVKTFITMARQTGPQRTMVQIPDLIEAALDMTGHALRAGGITLEQDIAADLPELTADGDQLIQVLINLIVNAQHAMEGQEAEPRLLIAAQQKAGRVLVEVSDNGPGVPEDVAARIFDPFFTTKDVGVGTGLGLSVCQSMIEAHGGTLELAKSAIGGATFRISLPLGEAEPAPQPEAEPAEAKAHRGSALIVDDEEEVAGILADMLGGMGLTCTVVTSGQAALEAMADHTYDAIFSDVRMPRMGGSELLAAIQCDHPDMVHRIIFATGDVLHPHVDKLRATGRPIVEKPYDPAQLDAALNTLVDLGEAA